jgi:hypothetical protein
MAGATRRVPFRTDSEDQGWSVTARTLVEGGRASRATHQMASSTPDSFSLYQEPRSKPVFSSAIRAAARWSAGLSTTQPRWGRRIRKGQHLRVRSIPTIRELTSSRKRPSCRSVVSQSRRGGRAVPWPLISSAVPPAATRDTGLLAGTQFVHDRLSQTACPSPCQHFEGYSAMPTPHRHC